MYIAPINCREKDNSIFRNKNIPINTQRHIATLASSYIPYYI